MAYNVYFTIELLALVLLAKWAINYVKVFLYQRKNGCKPGFKIPQFRPLFGYDIYKIQVNAFRAGTALESARLRYNKCGKTWSVSLMGKRYYNTIETENIKTILATNFKDFGLGGRQWAFAPLLGAGIFTTDGRQWEHSRALIRPNFTRSQVADLATFEAHIQKLISKIPRDESTIDLQPLFFSLTLDSATEFLFGHSVNSLNSTEGSDENKFGREFDRAQLCLGLRSRVGKFAFLIRNKQFDQACRNVHVFVDEIIRKELEKSEPKDVEKSIEGEGEVGRYVFLAELIKSTRDPKRLRDELLNILLAGRDTTASLLSNTFHALVRHPRVLKKLRAEIDTLDGRNPDYETLRNLKYLKYALNESLRLYPVVPANARYAHKDTFLPLGGGPDEQSPLFIPKGGIVAYSTYAMHRRPDIYGRDADVFRPERWASEEGLRPGWAYLPFNGGPRICVGQQFALTEASYTIVRLLQEFPSIEDRDGSDWTPHLTLTAASAKGVQVAITA